MKKNIMKKWVKALRSGEYAQGRGVLVTESKGADKFCCLGVLCNIMQEETGKLKVEDGYFNITFDSESGILPYKVMEWSGIVDSAGRLKYKNGRVSALAKLNDSGTSFKQLANIIEKHYEII